MNIEVSEYKMHIGLSIKKREKTYMQYQKQIRDEGFCDIHRHGGMTRSYEECNHGCVYYIIFTTPMSSFFV